MDSVSSATLLEVCRRNSWRIASAESCTGGLLAAALTETPGSSDVFDCGYVAYSNQAKIHLLGVDEATIQAFGAVSCEVAADMSRSALRKTGSDFAASVTGIAGPGGSEFKPEGRVCFSVAGPDQVIETQTMEFGPLGRDQVRSRSVEHAIGMLLRLIHRYDVRS